MNIAIKALRLIAGALILILFPCASRAGEQTFQPIPGYMLEVSFDIRNSKITGLARTDASAGQKMTLSTGRLAVLQISMSGRPVEFESKDGTIAITPPQNGIIEIRYEGVFRGGDAAGDMNYGVVESAISPRGISLTGTWYPQRDGLCVYTLKAVLPKGYEAVSEAENIRKAAKDGGTEFTFEFGHPADGISLIAADGYEITKDSVNGIELYAYFFKEDKGLAGAYITYAKKYFEMYENLLVKYPYKRFSIVENFLSTGYSMPTFTLLGQDVVRLPFIVETSLGHEILHQWFGNSVYSDYEKGNWAEGLTTYLADHLYEERKGRGWEYRKQLLINYQSYVNANNEFPLKNFRARTDFASRAIGYGKAAMVFHMLKNKIGGEAFYRALNNILIEKRFQKASWDDFRRECENASKSDLSWFFKQWLDEKGVPYLSVEDVTLRQNGSKFDVSFTIAQKSNVYKLDVPATSAYLEGGDKTELLKLDKDKNSVTLQLDRMPEKITFDENYDVARRLLPKEFPPVIARLIGDEKPVIVMPEAGKESYKNVVESFKHKGAVEKGPADVRDSDVKSSSLVILGRGNPLIRRLFGKVEADDSGFQVIIKQNPWNPQKVAGIIHSNSADEADAAFQKIFHYGKYSVLSFDKGRNVSKTIQKSERGMKMELSEEAPVVDISALKKLSNVIESVSGKKIVYAGEYHDRFSNHNVQLAVMQGLAKKNRKIAIGMEMFQRPFQKTLDDYVSGAIDEREFLKKSEYFKRWGFDYNLYKPILDFARENKIPVVALNLSRDITDKTAKEGMDSLTDEEKKELPENMDLSDQEYKDRLKQVFDRHEAREGKSFDYFYQAQIIWDETMSQSIDEFTKKNPDYQMIVLAGGGHLAYGSGIPKRTFRRNGLDYAIILSDADIDKDIADYVVFPQTLDGVSAPKLMALLKEENQRVSIIGLPEDSVSRKAGLKKGDAILSLDGAEVKSVEDLKLILFYKKTGETLKVRALRKRLLFGEKEMEFEVKL